DEVRWTEAPTGRLVDHIVNTHHAYLKEELPRLSALALKVSRVHGVEHPFLRRLSEAFEFFKDDLEQHMNKEERILFPIARKLPMEGLSGEENYFLEGPVRQMQFEHEEAGSLLEEFRQLTSNYTLPPETCGSFRALYERLKHLTEDMHRHVHLENEVLFPRFFAGT
ncbi:MAG: hemerythrin domain-containing protein, partial [Spirochaetia bacterium]|nr:hemerythrin domain-containing protein [Spirochaetia bacterium]